ncbi:hypothetical protein BGZ99_001576 [Dissophora globulifera]|uniref:Spindle pole body component n=1 Tax=Dissophora globulifera TaxID=979702 RepID=A0A9P6RNP8_9FUNG|nr:hypothetical protein BGZ99_001576 [Dissophora globulifera]
MDIDMDQGGLSGESGLLLAQFGLGLYPDLQGFFSPTLNMEQQASDTSLACPEMMAYLLEPATSAHSAPLAPSSDPTTWMRSAPTAVNLSLHHPVTLDSSSSIRSRLDTMAPLRILAEQSLAQAISARVLLINTCVLSLYFHDLNLLGHLEIMERFLLMRDGQFVASVGDALFDEETGLLTRSARAALMTGANATRMSGGGGSSGGVDDTGASTLANSVSASAVIGAMAGTEAGSLSAAGHGRPSLTAGDRRSSMISNASSATSWRAARQNWPPRSGELEMSLRAVLLDCLHSSMSGKMGRDIQQHIDTDVEHDHSDDGNPEEESRSDDVSEMEVEDDGVWPGPRSAVSLAKRRAKHDETKLHTRRPVDAQELEDTLAFAVMEYDDEIQISKDANALEALDFLYLDYKAPRPLRLLFFTPQALGRYRRLFTFQLRLARVEACLKQVYARLRVRHKHIASASTTMASDLIEALRAEITMLHRFRFEAQQIFDGFRGYVINVAMGVTWGKFMERLGAVQARIEDSLSGESSRSDGSNSGQSADGLGHLAAMHEYHDQVLDQMLMQSLLKRKQAPILKVVHAILNCILRLWQFAVRLPPVDADDDRHQEDDASIEQQNEEEESVERIHVRIARLQSLHEKFRSLCRMLVKVLKVLDERGLSSDNTHSSSGDNFLQQLLLRLDMSGFNDS